MERENDSSADMQLHTLLLRARPVRLKPGFTERVLASLPAEEQTPHAARVDASGGIKPKPGRAFRFGWVQIAACLLAAGLLWITNHASHGPEGPATEESWIHELASGEIPPSDLALIANLHEFLEAEIANQSTTEWLESINR